LGSKHLFNALVKMLLDPIQHEFVGGQQGELICALDWLQRPDPGIELLCRQLTFETA
jgi:hypothetical protein